MARRQRAEAERQEFLRQQAAIEQRNIITQFQIMCAFFSIFALHLPFIIKSHRFPHLNPAFVEEVLQKNGWNQQVCWNILSPLETAKVNEEQMIKLQQQQQQMYAEEQRKFLEVC